MFSFLKQLYPGRNFYITGFLLCMVFIFLWIAKVPLIISKSIAALCALVLLADIIVLFLKRNRFQGVRVHATRFSNHDENKVIIKLWHNFPVELRTTVIDELPGELELRQPGRKILLKPLERISISYQLKPFLRGEYQFGDLVCVLQSRLGLAARRIALPQQETPVKVYPSFNQALTYNKLANVAPAKEAGFNALQKPGQSYEFDHIKEYVPGDDVRNLNWKATARRSQAMVNHFTEERSQEVYALLDTGRVMHMPFDNLSLLDYAVNSTMMLTNVVLQKHDKMGVVTFDHQQAQILPATSQARQLHRIQERLYQLDTAFLESDYEKLFLSVRHKLRQRSLLLLFTNFESQASLQRTLPYLKMIAKHHLLVVVLFENSELLQVSSNTYQNVLQVYEQTIATQFIYDKRKMIAELQANGVTALLSTPEQLTASTINRYLMLKRKQLW